MFPNLELIGPKDVDELSNALRRASDDGLRVRVAGNCSKLGWGRPVNADLCISTHGMHRLHEHIWQDMTCTVDAGMTWSAMQSALAQHGQRVALDPLFANTATVGGILATNDSGTLRMKYGSLRDLVIGMTIVLPDGTIAKSGGKVVKNVAGYDLPKLMIGAFGTLGIIAEVTFRLHAIPRHTRHFTLTARAAQLQAKLAELSASQLSIESLQLRDTTYLDVALSAMPEVIDQQRATLHDFEETDATVWSAREGLFADQNAVILKASTLPTQIFMAVARVAELGGRSVAQSTGLITAALPASTSQENLAQLRAQIEQAPGAGSLILVRHSTSLDPFGTPPDSLPLQRAIKHRFDPTNTLNPGIFLGGI